MDGMIAAPTKAIKPVFKSSSSISLRIGKKALRHEHIHDLKTAITWIKYPMSVPI